MHAEDHEVLLGLDLELGGDEACLLVLPVVGGDVALQELDEAEVVHGSHYLRRFSPNSELEHEPRLLVTEGKGTDLRQLVYLGVRDAESGSHGDGSLSLSLVVAEVEVELELLEVLLFEGLGALGDLVDALVQVHLHSVGVELKLAEHGGDVLAHAFLAS